MADKDSSILENQCHREVRKPRVSTDIHNARSIAPKPPLPLSLTPIAEKSASLKQYKTSVSNDVN